MERVAMLNKKGLTLVEVLIALVVLLLVSLAMMQTALVSIDSNMLNVLRDEAVSIAEMRMSDARNIPFDTLVPDGPIPVSTKIRTIAGGFSYTTTRAVTPFGSDNKQVDIAVNWTWKGQNYTHTISTIVKRS
jgi:type IV pilus assembly protein PilV